MKVQLYNGVELEAIGVFGRNYFYQGVNRDSLVFLFAPESVSLDAVRAAFTPENCREIRLSDGNETFLHEHYTIRLELGIGFQEQVLTGSVKQDTTQCIFVTMAQSTLTERQLQAQQAALDALIIAALEE